MPGAGPRHLSAPAARTRRHRRVATSVATVIVVVGALTVVAVTTRRDHDSTRVTVGGPGQEPDRSSAATRSAGTTSAGRTAGTTTGPRTGDARSKGPASKGPASEGTATTAPTATAGGVLAGATVSRYLAGRTGDITAAVYDVDTATTSLLRPGVTEDTASIEKVDILATLLHTAEKQPADSDDDDDDDHGITDDQEDLATTMIEDSDNDAASDLWDDDGEAAGIAAFDRLVPLTDTDPGANGLWGLTTTTAADQVALVKTVALHNTLLDTDARDYELGLMEHVEPYDYWGVSGGIPSGVTVALKNGWLPLTDDDWQVNSIGWIDGDGRDYVVAVLTDDDPTEAYGIDTIEGLSSLVWDHIAS